MEKRRVLIVGLGNPGSRYEMTRHNAGYLVVGGCVKSLGLSLKKDSTLEGKISDGMHKESHIYFLEPTTYMNHSGVAVKKAMQAFQIAVEDLLVITDDVYIPFGSFRLREKGSSGGHNGLKSIEGHIGTQEFARLRVGISEPCGCSLEEHVLTDFTKEELEKMPGIVDQAKVLVDFWIQRDTRGAQGFIAALGAEKNSEKNVGE